MNSSKFCSLWFHSLYLKLLYSIVSIFWSWVMSKVNTLVIDFEAYHTRCSNEKFILASILQSLYAME